MSIHTFTDVIIDIYHKYDYDSKELHDQIYIYINKLQKLWLYIDNKYLLIYITIYMDRFIEIQHYNKYIINSKWKTISLKSLIIVCAILASKLLCDIVYANSAWARIGEINLKNLNQLELYLFQNIKLSISSLEYSTYEMLFDSYEIYWNKNIIVNDI